MLILKILGIFFLVLLILCCLAVLLTLPRAGVRIQGADGDVALFICYGRLRLRLYPLPRILQKKRDKEASEPARRPQQPFDLSTLELGDMVCFLLDLLDDLRDTLHIDTLRAHVVIATGDAAKTGILLGECAALLGMITPVLENTFTIRDYHIAVDGDFQSATPHWDAVLAFSVRPARLLLALWKRRRILLRFLDAAKPGSFTQNNGGETQ